MKKILLLLTMLPALCFADGPIWEEIKSPTYSYWGNNAAFRTSVPHGWIVYTYNGAGVGISTTSVFVPDENHEWTLQ